MCESYFSTHPPVLISYGTVFMEIRRPNQQNKLVTSSFNAVTVQLKKLITLLLQIFPILPAIRLLFLYDLYMLYSIYHSSFNHYSVAKLAAEYSNIHARDIFTMSNDV